ncbi:MAG: hypothetical protein IT286_05395 [Proteobacteria bacterium]|jgi:hypothetical protein|nr:hypothetical protein [Pseudomonadota bacterium]
MKTSANKIHVILGLALLTQVGCNANQQQRGQYINPGMAAMQGQDLTTTGDAFRRNTVQPGTGWGNALSNIGGNVFGTGGSGTIGAVPGGTSQGTPGTTGTEGKGTAGAGAEGAAKEGIEFKVNLTSEPLWISYCKELGGNPEEGDDTDGDGITDDCEIILSTTGDETRRLIALDPKVFNGMAVSTKRYYKENHKLFKKEMVEGEEGKGNTRLKDGGFIAEDNRLKSIRLTKKENETWKKSTVLGGFGSGVDSKFDRQVTKKFLALATQNGNDMKGLKDLFAIDQVSVKQKLGHDFKPNFEIIDENQAASRGREIGFASVDPKYGLVRADHMETIPFALSEDGTAVANLSGVASTVNSLRQDEEFIYIAETHMVVPAGGIELRIGNLMSDRTKALAGSKSGMFFVINGNNSVIVSSDLIENANKNSEDLKKSRGTIPTPTRCKTAHIVIAYFADSQKTSDMMSRNAIFAENVFYKDKKSDEWKLIPQEWLRLESMDRTAKSKCELEEKDILFTDLAAQLKTSKLPPVVDDGSEEAPAAATAQK